MKTKIIKAATSIELIDESYMKLCLKYQGGNFEHFFSGIAYKINLKLVFINIVKFICV